MSPFLERMYVPTSRMCQRKKTKTCLSVLWVFLSAVECGFHSLRFLSTGHVQPGARPDFEQVTVFDGVLISHCDAVTQQEQFKLVLESHNLIRTCEAACYDVFDVLKEISRFINNTLYVQRRRGCTTSAEGLESAFDIWAVNGKDFIQFDAGVQEWKALTYSAVAIKDSWNNREARNLVFGHFIKEQCPQMIQQIKLRAVEQRTDLRVFAKPIDRSKALLKCHVTSTDKSVCSVSLTGDGATKANQVTVSGPWLSVNGSVILRLTAEVPLSNTDIYGCVVQTGGKNITVMWDGNTLDGLEILYASINWRLLTIMGSVVFLVFFLLLAFAKQCCRLKSRCGRGFHRSERTKKIELSDIVESERMISSAKD